MSSIKNYIIHLTNQNVLFIAFIPAAMLRRANMLCKKYRWYMNCEKRYPAGTWRVCNVALTSRQRHATLHKCHVPAGQAMYLYLRVRVDRPGLCLVEQTFKDIPVHLLCIYIYVFG